MSGCMFPEYYQKWLYILTNSEEVESIQGIEECLLSLGYKPKVNH